MLDQSFYQKADEIIAFYGKKPASLIPIMQDIQGVYRYLPEELLTYCNVNYMPFSSFSQAHL